MVKLTAGIRALATDTEQAEIRVVGRVALQYVGKQEFPGCEPLRLWNIIAPWHPFHESTRSIEGLKELKIIKGEL